MVKPTKRMARPAHTHLVRGGSRDGEAYKTNGSACAPARQCALPTFNLTRYNIGLPARQSRKAAESLLEFSDWWFNQVPGSARQ